MTFLPRSTHPLMGPLASLTARVPTDAEFPHTSRVASIIPGLASSCTQDQFAGLTGHTLKNMRRALPRTGMKFPWSSQSMRLVGEIRCAQPKPSDADDEDDS